MTQTAMPRSIAELQAKLQRSGDSEWRKRIPKLNSANEELSLLNVKNIYNDELSEKNSILAAKKDELDAASRQWKSRVEQTDAVSFSVAGRMQQKTEVPTINISIAGPDNVKRTPQAKKFRGKSENESNEVTSSTPASPEKGIEVNTGFKRSVSLPGSGDNDILAANESSPVSVRKVTVARPDDFTFKNFFKNSGPAQKIADEQVSVDDFDSVVRQGGNLLVQKRTVRVQRRREATKNPVKALAAREDIKDEYTEVITGVVEKEKHRLNIEKLAKSSTFAIEALAGLASKEDFKSVALKRSSSLNLPFLPFQDLMLLHIKGRRHVQTRLVEPAYTSVNEGDCYVLVTPDSVYNYIGSFANVIEQSRAADVANHIQRMGDLGCKTPKVTVISPKKNVSNLDVDRFWKILKSPSDMEIVDAGHPDEDEIYESSVIGTNMTYEFKNDELVPLDSYWGLIPKIEILEPHKVFVFDFGCEMYVWSGKTAPLEQKKKALKLARELWNEGYNYTDCGINPVEIGSLLGSRTKKSPLLKSPKRPAWALFAKITQHRETILFKEKFLDWPDYSRVIKVKQDDDGEKSVDASYDFKPCDVTKMHKTDVSKPDLEAYGVHLGRGQTYHNKETNRLYRFNTNELSCWVILEYTHEKLEEKSVGQFYNGNSYIIRWNYSAVVTGVELSGKPSKHVVTGRDQCLYFCWQGAKATANEKGAAALLTVELDSENARQIRIVQGAEPPAFLNLFHGSMVVHDGKHDKSHRSANRLYICRGQLESEAVLTEVACSMRSLRSRCSFVLLNPTTKTITVWHGSKSLSQTRNITEAAAKKIMQKMPAEFGLNESIGLKFETVEESKEEKDFLNALDGEKRQLYMSLLKSLESYNYTPRLFHLTSISGTFKWSEVLCPYRGKEVTPYPFLQSDLYSANQPALFLLDNGHEIWLWQGWWPEREDDEVELSDQTGSGAVRWQAERKAGMQTVVDYCKAGGSEKSVPAYLVWAGLEPLEFTNLFPFWSDRDDVAELNMKEGRKAGELIPVENELSQLTRSTYPLEQLLQRPLPDGVDPIHLENYLSPEDFTKLMEMTLDEFQKLPAWRQTAVKKEKGLF